MDDPATTPSVAPRFPSLVLLGRGSVDEEISLLWLGPWGLRESRRAQQLSSSSARPSRPEPAAVVVGTMAPYPAGAAGLGPAQTDRRPIHITDGINSWPSRAPGCGLSHSDSRPSPLRVAASQQAGLTSGSHIAQLLDGALSAAHAHTDCRLAAASRAVMRRRRYSRTRRLFSGRD